MSDPTGKLIVQAARRRFEQARRGTTTEVCPACRNWFSKVGAALLVATSDGVKQVELCVDCGTLARDPVERQHLTGKIERFLNGGGAV